MNEQPGSIASVILKSLGAGLIGALLLPLLVLAAGIVAYNLDPRCGTPGNSGGCEMGIFGGMVMSILPGAIAGFAIGMVRGFWKRSQQP